MTARLPFTLSLCALIATSACTRDESEYLSTLPTFSGFKVENLTHINSKYFYKGDQIRVTAIQAQKGSRLYEATYTWSFAPSSSNSTKRVYYDKENADPSWTFTVDSLATSTLLLTAEYKVSGTGVAKPASVTTTDGSTANYLASTLASRITLQRAFTVLSN